MAKQCVKMQKHNAVATLCDGSCWGVCLTNANISARVAENQSDRTNEANRAIVSTLFRWASS